VLGDGLIRAGLRDQPEDRPLARAQRRKRTLATLPAHQTEGDRRVDDALAFADAPDRVRQYRDVVHPVLE
jgi:hypothetical protein